MDIVSEASQGAGELRSYGGEAGDARVARRRAALLDATLDLLSAPEAGQVTVRGICAHAGLTPRYFYESFDNADALVAATYDGVITEIAESARLAFEAGTDPRNKVTAAVRAIVGVIDEDRRKGRLIFSDALGSPVLTERRAQSVDLFAELTSRSVQQVSKGQGSRVRDEEELMAASHFQVGGFGRVLASWTEGRFAMDKERLVDLCAHMLWPEPRSHAAGDR
ncbi:TetR family transcriptional regulator [Gordonia sp. HY002]|uniref:TetR/AcrR family transcriptional regulator n=1 Tax=Gordonia zhenghanii TaxID=2911516 RepID=UPI001EEFF118|nr:TetR family transcriptional regulator [Gordonia zhenghanii]MCF8571933.1 TetR family transcriptional regulator [Gordonia zhenghanii]MCF8606989.1 TetR family transcriptional regulator [Gordonia zhenghanii]